MPWALMNRTEQNRLQTSRFAGNWEKFGLSSFLSRFIMELWNHSYTHTVNVDVDWKNWGDKNMYGSCKDNRCGRTDRHDLAIRSFGAVHWKNAKEKHTANSEPYTEVTTPPLPNHISLKAQFNWASLLATRLRIYSLLLNSLCVITSCKVAGRSASANEVEGWATFIATRWRF